MAVLRPTRLSGRGRGGGRSAAGSGGVGKNPYALVPVDDSEELMGPTECLGCKCQASEVASGVGGGDGQLAGAAGGSGGRKVYNWRDAGVDRPTDATFGFAVVARRDPCRAGHAAALGFHQAATGQWWGASEDLGREGEGGGEGGGDDDDGDGAGAGARKAHAEYQKEAWQLAEARWGRNGGPRGTGLVYHPDAATWCSRACLGRVQRLTSISWLKYVLHSLHPIP
jgi:hypothetical protein